MFIVDVLIVLPDIVEYTTDDTLSFVITAKYALSIVVTSVDVRIVELERISFVLIDEANKVLVAVHVLAVSVFKIREFVQFCAPNVDVVST